jgi:hypothetical protein
LHGIISQKAVIFIIICAWKIWSTAQVKKTVGSVKWEQKLATAVIPLFLHLNSCSSVGSAFPTKSCDKYKMQW